MNVLGNNVQTSIEGGESAPYLKRIGANHRASEATDLLENGYNFFKFRILLIESNFKWDSLHLSFNGTFILSPLTAKTFYLCVDILLYLRYWEIMCSVFLLFKQLC